MAVRPSHAEEPNRQHAARVFGDTDVVYAFTFMIHPPTPDNLVPMFTMFPIMLMIPLSRQLGVPVFPCNSCISNVTTDTIS